MTIANPLLHEADKLEFGDIKPTAVAQARSIVVASYNIRYAVGQFLISGGLLRKAGLVKTTGRADLVASHILTAANAFNGKQFLPHIDVLALQEADKETARAGGHHIARELAEQLEMAWVHVPAGIPRGIKPVARQWWLDFEEQIDLHDPGDTGVALLSNLPLTDVQRIDLPWEECAWRPRLAMAATISAGTSQLRIYNAHVDPHAAVGGQLAQLETLVAEAQTHTGPTMILGDFNTLSRKKVVETRTFLESHGYTSPIPSGTPTWRGAGLRLHADWIFVRDLRVKNWGVMRPLNVSDHWPIWVEVSLVD